MKTILLFPRRDQELWPSQPALQAAIADRYGFSITTADVGISAPDDVAELLSFWRPDGCIVNNDRLPEKLFADFPAVFCHRLPETFLPRHAYISYDEKAMSEAAARELLSLDLATYAFVPSPMNDYWSQTREQHFVHMLGLNGHGIAVFRHPGRRKSPPKRQAHLADWLADLPKPAGVFAANDIVAATVISACAHRKLGIPEDVAVIGVDNIESICETVRPSLSSVAADVVVRRDASYQLLSRLISGEPLESRQVKVKPLGVVRRASTLHFKKVDPAVLAACDLIRRRACEGLKARDVAATFPCGRRMAEIRFRAILGHSILDEIRAVRRAKAREATASLRIHSRDEIAASCGYSSWSSIHRLLADE